MAYAVSKRPDGGLHVKYRGKVSGAEMLAAQRDVYGSPPNLGKEIRYVISDWVDVREADLGTTEIRQASTTIQRLLMSNPRLVFVAVLKEDSVYGMGRMAQAYMDDVASRLKIFRSRPEAESWIRKTFKRARRS